MSVYHVICLIEKEIDSTSQLLLGLAGCSIKQELEFVVNCSINEIKHKIINEYFNEWELHYSESEDIYHCIKDSFSSKIKFLSINPLTDIICLNSLMLKTKN